MDEKKYFLFIKINCSIQYMQKDKNSCNIKLNYKVRNKKYINSFKIKVYMVILGQMFYCTFFCVRYQIQYPYGELWPKSITASNHSLKTDKKVNN